jgi:ribosomal protein S18 acetylase RimI-like enzyme
MIIRPAITADLDRLMELFQQEVAYQWQINPFFKLSPSFDCKRFVEGKLHKSNEQLLVADRSGTLAGYIDVRARVTAPPRVAEKNIISRLLALAAAPVRIHPDVIGWIDDCYVERQFRGQGIGSALVREGLSWLNTRGAARVELAVSASNGTGKAFWEKQGFSASRVLMSKESQPTVDAHQ